MNSYWYSTNGMSQRRLSLRHLSILDQAFERHARIQLYDDEVFGHNVPAIANPYQGTMTAGDLHFGLYRQPPMWRMSDTSLDTLILMDSDSQLEEAINNNNNNNSRHTNGNDNNQQQQQATVVGDNNLPHGVIVSGRNNNNNNNNNSDNSTRYKYIQRKRMILSQRTTEENCICCRIS